MNAPVHRYAFRAVKPSGETLSDVIEAGDRREALRRLTQGQLVVLDLREADAGRPGAERRRTASADERVAVLRQLAIMSRAGVELLDALETIASALGGETAAGLRTAATALRRGSRIADAVEEGLPGYPPYVYALIRAGEASGRLDRVLEEAAHQVGFERKIAREIRTSLTYPALLLTAGVLAMGFLFYVVVPRFAAMIGDRRDEITGLSHLVLSIGEGLQSHGLLLLAGLVALGASAATMLASPVGRRETLRLLERLPGVGSLMAARQRAGWARIMAFAMGSGVGLLESAALALGSVPEGRLREGLDGATSTLRAGRPVDEAFAGALGPLDLSLLRAGQRSGALAEMFRIIAEGHEDELRNALKRMTTLIEQAAIAFVALSIGAVVVSLVTAMTSIYDSVG